MEKHEKRSFLLPTLKYNNKGEDVTGKRGGKPFLFKPPQTPSPISLFFGRVARAVGHDALQGSRGRRRGGEDERGGAYEGDGQGSASGQEAQKVRAGAGELCTFFVVGGAIFSVVSVSGSTGCTLNINTIRSTY